LKDFSKTTFVEKQTFYKKITSRSRFALISVILSSFYLQEKILRAIEFIEMRFFSVQVTDGRD